MRMLKSSVIGGLVERKKKFYTIEVSTDRRDIIN